MASILQKLPASSCRGPQLSLLGVFTLLVFPTLATAQTDEIFSDNFDDGVLNPVWAVNWNQYMGEGDGAFLGEPIHPVNPRPADVPGQGSCCSEDDGSKDRK